MAKPQQRSSSNYAVNSALGLLGGLGIGAALMYILDPEKGEGRRQSVTRAASGALSSASDHVSSTIHTANDGAHSLASKINDYAHNIAGVAVDRATDVAAALAGHARQHVDNVKSTAQGYVDSAHGKIDDAHGHVDSLRQHIKDRANELLHRAKNAKGELTGESHHPARTTAIVTSSTLGLLALGAGAMYLLDPAKGRARRAYFRDKIFSTTRRAGHNARSYGRHLANRTQGIIHDAKGVVNNVHDQAAEVWAHSSDATVE